jgi:hypothetical protein
MRCLFQELDDRDAILCVAKDQAEVLKPRCPQSAIGARGRHGHSYLVLMGTAPDSAIIMAHLDSSQPRKHTPSIDAGVTEDCTSESGRDEHSMSLVRRVALLFVREPDLFRLPVACLIMNPHQRCEVSLSPLADRTVAVLKHLRVDTTVSFYEESWPEVVGISSDGYTVVAVRHGDGSSEIYAGNRLIFRRSTLVP